MFGVYANLCDTRGMNNYTSPVSYKGFRHPQDIISYAVWLYHRFSLSFRDVEELLYERGVMVTYEPDTYPPEGQIEEASW